MCAVSRWGVAFMWGAALAGCATTTAPPRTTEAAHAPPPAEVQATPSDRERAIERRRREAQKLEQGRDLVNAARHWSIVLALSPGDSQAAQRIGALHAAIGQAVKEELAAGREAMLRGDTDRAQRALLRALALDGRNEEAVGALREIDRKRALRLAIDRSARAQQAAAAESARAPLRPFGEAREFDLEQSLELLRAGDAGVALPELRRHVAANRADRATRARVAGALYLHAQRLEKTGARDPAVALYAEAIAVHPAPPPEWVGQLAALKKQLAGAEYEKGVQILATDVGAAIVHFEAALRFAPDHTQAQLQLQRARKMQRNLDAIEAPKGAR